MPQENGKGELGDTRPFRMLSPGSMVSHYRIVEQIGAGGMGVVYKAIDTKLDRTAALKFMPPHLLCDPDARERFIHEAKAASALSHPNITTIYEIEEAGGQCFLAMEYVEGSSIRDALKQDRIAVTDILDIAIQIAEGLHAAHSKDVVHRDIKPGNVMVTKGGLVKIMDFGLAKLKGVTKLTKTGTTLGTLPYMSPEQAAGKEVDQRSDIFSFGVMLYEMIAGRLPFRGENEAAIVNSIVNDTPEPLARYKADVPQGVQHIVDKALAKNRDERYQHADDLLADLKHERRISDSLKTAGLMQPAGAGRRRTRILRLLAIAAVVAVIAVIYFVFEPFRVEVGPEQAAVAEDNSLAVMYFENMVDPEDTDRTAQMITALLITDLSESGHIRVVSRQRLYDILKMLGQEDVKVIDKSVASEVARRAGVKWILTGNILRTDPGLVLTAEVSDAAAGDILASHKIDGGAGSDIFAVADRLGSEIQGDLSVPQAVQARPAQHQPPGSTRSPEAYRSYLEGWDYVYKYYFAEAAAAFRKALEHDSTFAMAYWSLARVVTEPEKAELMAGAVKHSDQASEFDRAYIGALAARYEGDYVRAVEIFKDIAERYPNSAQTEISIGVTYRHQLGKPENAIPHYLKALEIDPFYKEAYNQLAYAYDDVGNLDQAIWAINEYISLAPGEPNPFDTRGDLYAYNERIDEALDSYRKASALKPGFSTGKEGAMYLFQHQYARAESCFKDVAASSNKWTRSRGRLCLAVLPAYQGKFNEALRVLEDGLAADRMDEALETWAGEKYRLISEIYLARGDYDSAIDAARMCMELRKLANPDDLGFGIGYYVHALLEAGRIAEAEELAGPVVDRTRESPANATGEAWLVIGLLEWERGNQNGAVEGFTRALDASDEPYFHLRTFLAEVHLAAGNHGEAVGLLERALARHDFARSIVPIRDVKSRYWLGLAYEESGWDQKAVRQYEEFLEIWRDADPGIPEIEDARQRLARLKQSS
jgi:tetratricopeptide (TPR) repeat protein/TolB-like protein